MQIAASVFFILATWLKLVLGFGIKKVMFKFRFPKIVLAANGICCAGVCADMCFVFSKPGITKALAIAIVGVVLIGAIVSAYVVLQFLSPSSSPRPSASPTLVFTPTVTPSLSPTPTFNAALTPTPNPVVTPTPIANSTPTSVPTQIPTPFPGQDTINVTGHALYELSGTEFVFSDGQKTYNVTMDETTQCVNLLGNLLGGSQFVSQIIMVTSLPITITGIVNGSTIKAQIVLIPTTKDKIT